jgi:hypothetical protein
MPTRCSPTLPLTEREEVSVPFAPIIGLPITTPIWILLWIYIFWSKRKFFKEWCDAAFKLSVDFLLKFQRIGWSYWKASVIICVVVPIIIYAVLILMMI